MAEPWLELDLRLPLGAEALTARLSATLPVLAVTGPSGSGKTTLLRALAGLDRRGTGMIRALGQTWLGPGTWTPPWERRAAWVPQEAALFPHMSVRQNLGYAGADGLDEIASMLGLQALLDRAPRNLSGGERQRVALGRAMLARPRALLLDEPFSALDRALRARLGAQVASWCAARQVPVVLVSHDERDLEVFQAETWQIREGALQFVSY